MSSSWLVMFSALLAALMSIEANNTEKVLAYIGDCKRAGLEIRPPDVNHSFAGTPGPARRGGLEFADVTSGGVSGEVALTDWLQGLVQVEAETSTLRRLGFDRVSDAQVLLWTGLRAQLADNVAAELALGEDLTGFIAPDFTAFLGLAITL